MIYGAYVAIVEATSIQERIVRGMALVTGAFAYLAAKALGISVPTLMVQAGIPGAQTDTNHQFTMLQRVRYQLHFGPYRTPAYRYGKLVVDGIRGNVRVVGTSGGRIPWAGVAATWHFALEIVPFGSSTGPARAADPRAWPRSG